MNGRIFVIILCLVIIVFAIVSIIFLPKQENRVMPAMVSATETAVITTEETTTIAETTTITTTSIPTTTEAETTTKTFIMPQTAYIEMENILQNPELPTGCEITAFTILLNFYGYDAEKTDMAKNHLPVSWGNVKTVDGEVYKDSFFEYFIGDPFGNGYGCFAPAIMKAAESYLPGRETASGKTYIAEIISGASPEELYSYVGAGTPVLCWATDGMIEPEYKESWIDNETGEKLDWYYHEHCFVLVGYDDNIVTLSDPMKGIISYNRQRFELRYSQMYSQAIILKEYEYTESNNALTSQTLSDTGF
jgi:uncharacterized protein YvpB